MFYTPVAMTAMSENDKHRYVADTLHVVFTFLNPFYTAGGFFYFLLKVGSILHPVVEHDIILPVVTLFLLFL